MARLFAGHRRTWRFWVSLGPIPLLVLLLGLLWTATAPALTVPTLASMVRPTFSSGSGFSLVIRSDGSLWGWGENMDGEVGDGTTSLRTAPEQVGSASNWITVDAGYFHSLAIRSDGSLWAWGRNESGELGDGTTTNRLVPTRVGTGTDWVAVSAGDGHSLALKSDGSLWTWGSNQYGELGDGTTTNRLVPTRVGSGTNWVAVSAGGWHSLALKSDGSLWAWGSNSKGQLGDNTTADHSVPTHIYIGTGCIAVQATGVSSLVLASDGSMWAWGGNSDGEVGDGTPNPRNRPGRIGSDTDWKFISAQGTHCEALKINGSLWAWGNNGDGRYGDGTTGGSSVPKRVGTANDWVSVSAGGDRTMALKSDGSLWISGGNVIGELGVSPSAISVPNQVLIMSGVKIPSATGGGATTTTTTAQGGGSPSFSDVSASNPYGAAIANMASLGIIGGFPDGTFGPDKPVLRKQFAKMIVGAMGLPVSESDWQDSNPPFTDCGPDDPNSLYPHDYIAVAKANGLVSGKTATAFAPEANITRAQMITMVVRAAQNSGIELLPVGLDYGGVFQDYTDPTHGANVHLAEYNGLLSGLVYHEDPLSWITGGATRGEVAQVLWNLHQMGAEGSGTTTTTVHVTTTTTVHVTTTTTVPSTTTTTEAGNQPLFSDDFSSDAQGWPEASTSIYDVAVDTAAAQYVMKIYPNNHNVYCYAPVSYSDLAVEVDGRCATYGAEGRYGLMFRASSDKKNMYWFLVSTHGYWQLVRWSGGTRTYLTDSNGAQDHYVTEIRQGTAWNHLEVVADGSTITLYINGAYEATLTGASLTYSGVGVVGWSDPDAGTEFDFDNFVVWPPGL